MQEYYILTQDPHYRTVIDWVFAHSLPYSPHLNRTRFSVPAGSVHTEFALRFGHCCPLVDPTLDLITGQPKNFQLE